MGDFCPYSLLPHLSLSSPLPFSSALILTGLGWLSCFSQAASEEMLHATPVPTCSSHPSPCAFVSALFFSQIPAASETIAPIQRFFGNRKVLSREHVSQAQHGSQGLPCLPFSATQESGKVNLCVCSQASCQCFWVEVPGSFKQWFLSSPGQEFSHGTSGLLPVYPQCFLPCSDLNLRPL